MRKRSRFPDLAFESTRRQCDGAVARLFDELVGSAGGSSAGATPSAELSLSRAVSVSCADYLTDELFFSVPSPSKASSSSSSSNGRTRQRRCRGWLLFAGLNLRRMPDQCLPTIFVPTEENPNG